MSKSHKQIEMDIAESLVLGGRVAPEPAEPAVPHVPEPTALHATRPPRRMPPRLSERRVTRANRNLGVLHEGSRQ
jgi:hypothetical protein